MAGSTPGPVSSTATLDLPVARRAADAHLARRRHAACTAFSSRFTNTWRSWIGSPSTAGRPVEPVESELHARPGAAPPATRRRPPSPSAPARASSGRSRIMSSSSVMIRSRCRAARRCGRVLAARARPRRRAALQDVERGLDDAERVAQLVADGADQLAEGGEPLDARLLREQVLAVGVQHDRELEIEDLARAPTRAASQRAGSLVVSGRRDPVQLLAEHVHRAEHVVLRQRDAHVHAADAAARARSRPRPTGR